MNKLKNIHLNIKNIITTILLTISFLLLFLLEQEGRPFVFLWITTIFSLSLFGKIFFSKYLKELKFSDGCFAFSFAIATSILFLCNWIFLSVKPIANLNINNISFVLNMIVMVIITIASFFIKKHKEQNTKFITKIKQQISNKETKEEFFKFLFGFSIFAILFAIAYWVKGFNPDVYSTEKFMDYGFMETMYRQQSYPPNDMWFSNTPLNYYYLGQACSVFLCNISFVTPEYGYNFMLCTLFAMLFVSSFSFVEAILAKTKYNKKRHQVLGGIIAGLMTTFAGNGHWILYGIIYQIRDIINKVPNEYWFPNSTRFIGYDPDVADKTIHEFPSYSFVLGDLHAHVCNIMFTIPLLILLVDYTFWLINNNKNKSNDKNNKINIKEHLLKPNIILTGVLLGLFQGVNYWDFPIYFVIAGAIILFSWYKKYGFSFKNTLWVLFLGTYILAISSVVIYPFNRTFIKMASEIKLCENHTPFYQLAILWGIPITIVLIYFAYLIVSYIQTKSKIRQQEVENKNQKGEIHKNRKKRKRNVSTIIFDFLNDMNIEDILMVSLSLCAIGLVLMPEIIYIKDIYGDAYARSNTMFKLTYQAFILFGLVIGYIVGTFFNAKGFLKVYKYFELKPFINDIASLEIQDNNKNWKRKTTYPWLYVGSIIFAFVLLLSSYTLWSTKAWFGNVFDLENRKGISATNFLETHKDFKDDFGAIEYINKNDNRKIINIVEATGTSYTSDCKLSTFTGANTVMGWHTHEWLWKSDLDLVDNRVEEVKKFYEDGTFEYCKKFINKYNIDYIFIGMVEREKYEIDTNKLLELGNVVWENKEKELYLIKIDK